MEADADARILWDKIIQRAKEAMGIDSYLASLVSRWTGVNEADFAALADKDERLYILADRIRCIHPRYPERVLFHRRLGQALTDPAAVPGLLKDVSGFLKRVEYKDCARLVDL